MVSAKVTEGRTARMPLINRFQLALQAGRKAVADLPDISGSTVAALVIGQGSGELAAASAWLRAGSRRRAVLITDQTGVELYQLPDLVTEFLPTRSAITSQSDADPARRLYVQRRLAIIFTKWKVAHCAAIGSEAETLLAAVTARGGEASGFPMPTKARI